MILIKEGLKHFLHVVHVVTIINVNVFLSKAENILHELVNTYYDHYYLSEFVFICIYICSAP